MASREIKFRALFRGMDGEKEWKYIGANERFDQAGWSQETPWLQYIGLKDRAGKEIYEGDIVKWGNLKGDKKRPMRIAMIEIDPDIRFRQINGNKHVFHFSTFYYRETEKWLEVIGNIHENPELIPA